MSSCDAAVLEGEAGAGDEILDRARDEHLAGLGVGGDARAGVHRDPRHLAVQQLALAGMEARAHLEAERVTPSTIALRAADRPRRPVEAGEEAVPGGVHLVAAEPRELARTSS